MANRDDITKDSPAEQGSTNQYVHTVGDALDRNVMHDRTAEHHGAFFLPYLIDGARLLDCGCGPGTITLGYAKYVGSEGEVVGIDREQGQVEEGRRLAAEMGAENVRFETGDIYRLPFADNSFDAVVSTTTFEHLHEPVAGFKELLRVVRPGGPVGVRANDWMGGLNLEPTNTTIDNAINVYLKYRAHNGGHPNLGKRLRSIAMESGSAESKWTASCDYWADLDAITAIKEVLLNEFAGSKTRDTAIDQGWADEDHFNATERAIENWSQSPGAVFVLLQGEVVAWKPA